MQENEEDYGEKTEEPSQHRLEEFRSKGRVAASRELANVLVLSAALATLSFSFSYLVENFVDYITWMASQDIKLLFEKQNYLKLIDKTVRTFLLSLAPLFVIILSVGIGSYVLQIGFIFAPEALKISFDRVNPINGLQRLFSMKSLVETLKTVLKFSIILVITYVLISDKLLSLSGLYHIGVIEQLMYGKEFLTHMGLNILLGMLLVVLVDFAWEKYNYRKQLLQSRQQLKEEQKEKEGNPEIKQRIRNLQREMSQKRMMAEVPKADVIIANPTHISVAIKYDTINMMAPIVVAKGADSVALKIREMAKKHDVPIVEKVSLARNLYKTVKIGESIPRNLYKVVAEILAYVYKKRANK